ncbi:MAG: hypothetical protein GW762_04465 [Candidatus Pacebacteria bacterium]|nr:hypothetical protein [Candidatus Paceibacterota bacterium]PIR64003.1 MAG: hypothetical protein COU64_01110 [Candidatus Pacebacteria bacterium CG10_big_fil_rev_8_21_14_0_10_40_26]PIZ79623.1 MAG: hypothetical protein COY01_00685 [Candidatus Pacebacteria bacterium CG_4_10_14_0_2_um_filter_40_20]PJA69076.1 MAG: hypothetical protein CO156_01935 [Candidatus Pacebacteria bacterium CG_4_9_14_3_um_filter_40_12]PJC41790.1 MAG: hypothetical protein CO041_03670 [Candidatus Pacebacteria bacterium CG_4_9_
MKKACTVFGIAALSVFLVGCTTKPADDQMYAEPEMTIEQTMDAAELTPEQAETQMVSDDDSLETIQTELDATVILDEDLSNL